MNIGAWSVKNPVFLNILVLLILFAGYFSIDRLPKEQFAEIPFYYVNISVPYPGASAEDIEQTVTIRIENEMAGLDRLNEIQSITTEGLARVTLQFDQGLNDEQFKALYQEVQNRFTNLDLPEGTLQGTIDDFSTNDFLPVVEVVLSGDVPFDTLSKNARDLSDRLRTISDVSGVALIGDRDRQFSIDLNADRMEALGVSLDEVVAAIQNRNVTIPAGTVRTRSNEFLLRTVGQLDSESQFRETVVRHAGSGRAGTVRVGDLGSVTKGYDENGTEARFNGRQAISLQITKIPGGSSIGILNEVRRRTGEFQEDLPPGISVNYFNDSTIAIRDSLDVLVSNALFGLGLLVIILLLFIGVRNALMTALGIPITFGLTFIVLEAFGETLNGNTLFGLVLVLGLIVDHAIVIVENSFRLQQEQGMSRHQAAIHGVNQVVVPVIAATLTTIAAFLPLTFLPGIIGKFLRVVPLTVTIALIASTFEAIVFIPSHYADWPGGGRIRHKKRLFNDLPARFRRLLEGMYRRRRIVVVAIVVVMVGVFSLIGSIQQNLFSSEDASLFYIDIEMAPGTPISKTGEFIRQYESRLLSLVGNGEVVAINAFVGFSGGESENVRRSNVGQIVVDLEEQDAGRLRSVTDVMADAREMTRDIPGAEVVQFRKQQGGPPTDPPVAFRLFGDSFDDLSAVSAAIRERLNEKPQLFNITDNLEGVTPELQVRVDEHRASELGLSTQKIGRYVRGRFDGIPAGIVFSDNQESDVVVRFAQDHPISVEEIQQMRIPTPDGRLIPFSAVARLDAGETLSSIRRIDGKREVTITAETYSDAVVPSVNSDVQALFREDLERAYPGVTLNVGGEFAEFADTLRDILRVFVIGIFLIYLVLATQFRSYTQPLLILLTVPFSFVGVVLFLVFSGTPLSTTVIYASVALAGIAVNDAIVLISFANDERRDEQKDVMTAVIDAAVTRLRPIILTSITTIAGLLPTAIGLGGASVVWGPMASTIIFGLLFSTLTSLFVVPSFYGLLYDRRSLHSGSDESGTRTS